MSDEHNGPIRTVLIAVDLTPRSAIVVRWARRVVTEPDARFVLMHVVSDLESLLGVYASGSPVEPLQSDIESRAVGQLASMRETLLGDRPDAATELRKGPVWSEIVAAAIANRADLLFMGSHSSDSPRLKAAGDIAKVIRISPCPIVIVPSEEL